MSAGAGCDVVVVGLGAAGGLAAGLLARSGLDVVGLEAGPWHAPVEYAPDEVASVMRNHLGAAKVNDEIPTVRGGPEQVAAPTYPAGLLMMNGVGGSKVHSGQLSWRQLPRTFETRSQLLAAGGEAAIPTGSTIADWPLRYDELEPYYARVEDLYGISGQAGNLGGTLDPRGNVFEGSRSGPFPLPPLRPAGFTQLMHGAAEQLGWNPFPAAASIRSAEYHGMSACTYCGSCLYNGCWTDAKGLPSSKLIPDAIAEHGLRAITGARVVRIDVDADGRASGVTYVLDGQEHSLSARAVVLGTFTYENTRLLLLSKGRAFPNGLANGTGQVGRHYMTHTLIFRFGLFAGTALHSWTGTPGQTTALSDFDQTLVTAPDGAQVVGGGPLMAGMGNPMLLSVLSTPPSVARWGTSWKRWLAENLRSVGFAYAIPDAVPYEQNRLDLDPTHVDRTGMPLVRVTFDHFENERRQIAFMTAKLQQWLSAAGASEQWQPPIGPSPISTHSYGGTRMGDDPQTSVVNRWGIAHEVPNLAIVGASCFPTPGGVNPTLTVEALTWRTVEHLIATLQN